MKMVFSCERHFLMEKINYFFFATKGLETPMVATRPNSNYQCF